MAPRKNTTRKTVKARKAKASAKTNAQDKIAALKKLIDLNEQALNTLYPKALSTLQKQKTTLMTKKKAHQAKVKTSKIKVVSLKKALKAKKNAAAETRLDRAAESLLLLQEKATDLDHELAMVNEELNTVVADAKAWTARHKAFLLLEKTVAKKSKAQPAKKKNSASAKRKIKKATSVTKITDDARSQASTTPALVDHAIQIGSPAPLFSALTDMNETFSLEACRGQYVVLYFYPKDSTPGCTKEAHDFTDHLEQFTKKNARIVGLSRDSVTSHAKFKEKELIGYTLLSDADEAVCERYGVLKNKTLYGKAIRSIERTTILIDPEGKIACIWWMVKVPGHVAEVLEAIN